MKRHILIAIVLLSFIVPPTFAQQRRGRQHSNVGGNLTLALARRILIQHLNEPSVNNMLLTCRACYSPDDKGENDNFAVVSEYGNIKRFLMRQGYIRAGSNGEVFTAKAKRSRYFEAYGNEQGSFGGAGFRLANFRNPRILVNKITDPRNVPIEYDRVPTPVTMPFFGKVDRIRAVAAFSYEDGRWNVCIDCRN